MSILRALPLVLLAFALAACASKQRVHRAMPHDSRSRTSVSRDASMSPRYEVADGSARAHEDETGLGTMYGERRHSGSHETRFERASSRPETILRLWYDDFDGVAASSGSPWRSSTLYDHARDVSVSLVDERGRVLDALDFGHQRYAIGEPGSRYEIEIHNHSGQRYEVVASVDGLDVIDGGHATTRKRGYILDPHDTLVIEGWRTHEHEVAAFRFGRAHDSYASRRGATRDVGVIGVALFSEDAPRWTPERERRRHARPFDDRFAPPPSW